MKTISLAIAILLVGVATAWADEELRYNPYSNTWTYEAPDTSLQYNPYQNEWTYERPGTETQYNPYSRQFEYPHTQSDRVAPQYNPYSGQWEQK